VWFNLGKLGAIVRRYSANHYGPLNDRINRGLKSDRVYAEWWIRSRRVERRIAGEHEPVPEGSALVEIPLNVSRSPLQVGSFQRSPGASRPQAHLLVRGLTTPPSHGSL